MNILVEGSVLFYNNLCLEEIWSDFGNTYNIYRLCYNLILNIFNKYKLCGNLKSLPYSGYFMSIYKEELEKYQIHIALYETMEIYKNLIIKDITNLHNIRKITIYKNEIELQELISKSDDVFMNDLSNIRKYNGRFGIVNNIISFCIMFVTTKVEHYRVSIFHSIWWVIWSLFHYYNVLLYLFPLLFRLGTQFNESIFITSLGTFALILSFFKLLRSLQEIDYERSISQKSKLEPLISSEYIFNGASVGFSTIILFGLLSYIIYLCFSYPLIMIINICIGIVYYIFMLSPIVLKYVTLIGAISLGHFILQYKWAISLLWKK